MDLTDVYASGLCNIELSMAEYVDNPCHDGTAFLWRWYWDCGGGAGTTFLHITVL